MPSLRDELGLSHTVTGLHLSAFALGMVLAGTLGDYLVRHWGRQRGRGAGMAAEALVFILGRHAGLTVADQVGIENAYRVQQSGM